MPRITRRTLLKGLSTVPLAVSSRAMATTATAGPHVAVIGAGAFGGWTALHLLRAGARVTLIDSWGPGNSRASSGGESRVIRGMYGPDRVYVKLVKRSFELWQQNERRWQTRLYHRTGLLWMFTAGDTYAKQSLPIVREHGFVVDSMTVAAASKTFPQINFDGVQTLYFEHEAGYLSARHACQTVCRQFQQEGGTFRQIAVKPGAIRSESLEHLELSDGSHLAADHYVFACGPWLGRLFPKLLGDGIAPTRQEVYYFGTPKGDRAFESEKLPVWVDFDERLYYGIPGASGRGFKVADDTRGEPFDPTVGDRTPSQDGIARAREFLGRRFPKLQAAPLLEARVCQYENSPDGHLIVDRHPGANNAWLVGGGSGHGFKLSPALGEHVAACVLREQKPDPFFGIERLAKLNTTSTQFDQK